MGFKDFFQIVASCLSRLQGGCQPKATWASQVAALRKLGTRAPSPHREVLTSLHIDCFQFFVLSFKLDFHLKLVATPDAAGSTSAFQQLGGASTICILSL